MSSTTESSPSGHRKTTRHHRVDLDFLELLEGDFGIPFYALRNAFYGVPPEPKKSAIHLCEWALRADDPARALLAWARKNRRGTFRPVADFGAGDDL